jgi:GNAT superfamily N-acetyltransferase
MDMPNRAHPAPAETATPPEPRWQFGWVPIRSLASRHRPRILKHLLSLSAMDRYLRFGYPASDAQIGQYVDMLDFERDEVFGIFNRRLELLAMAHLAYLPSGAAGGRAAEFGVSVIQRVRGRRFGERLFDHAVLHARNRHVETLIIHALTENTAMMRIVRKAGAQVERDGGEAQARLKLPPEDLASHLEQIFGEQAAEFDYRLKAGARQVDGLLGKIVGMSGGRPGGGPNAPD